jgi:hypothetical protein
MHEVPNAAHSRKIRELCEQFSMADPFRALFPEKIDFSYAPWGNLRNNRSRIDFFLVYTTIIDKASECYIKPSVQSKLFDHKAIVLKFGKNKDIHTRPTITNGILRDPDIEKIVKLASLECYAHHLIDVAVGVGALNLIGRCHALIRRAGPDPNYIEYSHAVLVDVDDRNLILNELRALMFELEELNLQDKEINLEGDA